MNTPKTSPCKDCGQKPKREIVAFGFSDKDDEFFLVHKCKGKPIRFPKRGTFSQYYANAQEPLVVTAWNALNEGLSDAAEGENEQVGV